MKTRRVLKEKFTNKIMQDATGEELEFPDVEANDYPEVGDKVLLDGNKATGERLMPNLTVIKFKDGVVTHIIQDPDNPKNISKVTAVRDHVCKEIRSISNQKIEILGHHTSNPFREGNRILVNGKAMKIARCEVAGRKLTIINGRISEVKASNESKGARRVIKANGKIDSRSLGEGEENEILNPTTYVEASAIRIEKIKFMKKLK